MNITLATLQCHQQILVMPSKEDVCEIKTHYVFDAAATCLRPLI